MKTVAAEIKTRKEYVKPELTKHKPVREITLANQTRKTGACTC
jgi:hypothetical protein